MTTAASSTRRRLLVAPDIEGPRVRLGVMWFLLAMAAVTSGREWISLLCGGISALAGYQLTKVWGPRRNRAKSGGSKSGANKGSAKAAGHASVKQDARFAAAIAGTIPLLAGYSTGAAGLALLITPALVVGYHSLRGGSFVSAVPTLTGAILPPIAAIAIVLTVRADLWAGLFLVMAISLYDAGSFLHGAEASSRWEGPAAGIIGVGAVTFTMAVFHPSPFTPTTVIISGVLLAVTAPIGQMVTTIFLPRPDAKVQGMRRLDAYLIAAPAFYICFVAISA